MEYEFELINSMVDDFKKACTERNCSSAKVGHNNYFTTIIVQVKDPTDIFWIGVNYEKLNKTGQSNTLNN